MSDTDLTERVQQLEIENARLRRQLDQWGMPGTLRHQVRNALGLMRAILRLSVESKTAVDDFAAHVEGRFDALLRVQSMLMSSPDGTADLFALVSNELVAHAVQIGDTTTLGGPDMRIEARTAELLGLVVHELVMNAIKFGALSAPRGQVDVSWTAEASRLVLTWVERGCEHPVASPRPRGFGSEAIEGMLPYQLKAESRLDFTADGLHCTVAIPIESRSRHAGEADADRPISRP